RPALALATDKAEDRAGVDDEDVAVDVEVRDLRDVAGDGQALLRGRREAAPVVGRRVGEDLLLRRVDDVQVVEPGALVADERADVADVVAPAGRPRDLHPRRPAVALGVDGPPAPDDVPGVDDEEVAAAGREDLRDALGRSGLLALLAVDHR